MALQKQVVNVNFGQGLDLKTDPYQVAAGKFLALNNSVFDTVNRATKRNGFPYLSVPASTGYQALNTFKSSLIAIGPNINSYSPTTSPVQWFPSNTFNPSTLNTVSMVRNGVNQIQCDSANANGLTCVVYTQSSNVGSNTSYFCTVANAATGQSIIAPTPIVPSAGSVSGAPRVFVLGSYFIVFFTATISAAPWLEYFVINTTSTVVGGTVPFNSNYGPASTIAFDGAINPTNGYLYIAWQYGSGTAGTWMNYITPGLSPGSASLVDTTHGNLMSVCIDASNFNIYVANLNTGSGTGSVFCVNTSLASVFAGKTIATGLTNAQNIACFSIGSNGVTTLVEYTDAYSYDSSLTNNSIAYATVNQTGTTITGSGTMQLGAGLASKVIVANSAAYMFLAFSSIFQPSYFLYRFDPINFPGIGVNRVVAKFAYQNGGGYLTLGLPSISVAPTAYGDILSVPYLIKDLIQAVNKNTGTSANQVPGIYTQTGINIVNVSLFNNSVSSLEIGSNLNINGGFLAGYDGSVVSENNFFLYPDTDLNTDTHGTSNQLSITAGAGGGAAQIAQDYYYALTYEFTDNQGNIFRSAPSVPIPAKQASYTAAGSAPYTTTINIPTLRLTNKNANQVVIGIYRWSADAPTYYRVGSVLRPTLNSDSASSVSFTDGSASTSIEGNEILYTTGGVLEDVSPPACTAMTLFDDRLWLVDAEDQNLLWYSKQAIENTPLEMSDLLTFYVAPTIGGQGTTGVITALAYMDDKLIVFKGSGNALYYINGTGPDNTGANGQYTQPIFITSPVGCSNQKSITLTPNGLMFQAADAKGIWLLGRDLSVQYIGAPVEAYNNYTVNSAVAIPATNQVRFTLNNGTMLVYDYFVGQWSTFTGYQGFTSCLYNNLQTLLDGSSNVYQEAPGTYYDNNGGNIINPVLMSLTTSWINLAGLRGYQRAYFFFLLGTYLSQHELQLGIAYDYDSTVSQTTIFNPSTQGLTNGQIEQFRCFLQRQRCKSIQLQLTELAVPGYVGAGLTISGLNFQIGHKKSYSPTTAIQNID